MFLIVLLTVMVSSVYAFDLEYRANYSFNTGLNEAGQTLKTGLEHEIRAYQDYVFLWGSIENITLYSNEQDIKAGGIGLKAEYNRFKFWVKAGYYMPKEDQSVPWEPAWLYQSYIYSHLGSDRFDNYAITLDPAIGGELGVDFLQPITDSLKVGISMSYRVLTIYEHMDAWNTGDERGTTGWISEINRDFSCGRLGVMFVYIF